jgi:hypothetical protein
MFEKLLKALKAMELEEKIFLAGIAVGIVGMFLPWITVGTYGEAKTMGNGLNFRTGFIGHFVLLIELFILAMTASPLLGGPVLVRKSLRTVVALLLTILSAALLIGAFTVLLRLTFEVSGTEVRFGIYVSLIGSALATLYALLRYQEQRRSEVHELFHHPDQPAPLRAKPAEPEIENTPPPPPPPPPPPLEEHSLFSGKQ